jgi:hypothetical protein
MKLRLKNIFPILVALVFLKSCVDPYEPDISRYENVFVVDGELNNMQGPYEVRLTRSFTFEEDSGINITGAQVMIIENTGLEVTLRETREGLYCTDSSFRARIGNSYKLQITYNGEVYETEFETLKIPIPIDSIYWEYQDRGHEGVDGIQLLLDTHDPENNTHYYAWEYEETWKFVVPIQPIGRPEWKECFMYSGNYDFKIGTSIQKTGDRMERYPLLFIDEKTNKLRWRYSILVKQFTLSEQAYQFYSNLIELNENQGTLFDPVPYSLTGNVKCVTNEEKPVLGYFLVSGVSEKRIFIDNKDLPYQYQPISGFESCYSRQVTIEYELIQVPVDSVVPLVKLLPYSLSKVNKIKEIDSLRHLGISVFDIYIYTVGDCTDTTFKCGDCALPYLMSLFSLDSLEAAYALDTLAPYLECDSNGYCFCGPCDTIISCDTVAQISLSEPRCFNCTLTGDNKVPDYWVEE